MINFMTEDTIMSVTIKNKPDFKAKCLAKTKSARKANAGKVTVKSAAAPGLPNDLAPDLEIVWHPIDLFKPPKRRARKASMEQVKRAITSIRHFGMVSPITIRKMVVVDGHSRIEAARELGMSKVPCVDVAHLSEEQARMLAISLNRLGERGDWDLPELKLELEELELDGFDLSLSFFAEEELDIILADEIEEGSEEDEIDFPSSAVSVTGDLWLLGKGHRVLCGNALDPASYALLLDDVKANVVLTDPPYNVKIAGNVSGLGKTKHGEFQFASGEMTEAEFSDFLKTALAHCRDNVTEGAVLYAFMDWRSIDLLMAAARDVGLSHSNTAVWHKGSGAMGGFLRSAYELCGIFCKGSKPKTNNVQLGRHGRDRTNVWTYPGANRPGSSAGKALKDHPTPKNIEMCIDALLDVTQRDDIVLDPFLGSGTTILAAEKARRFCMGIELEPIYVDVCIRRWQDLTGKEALLATTGQMFSEVAKERMAKNNDGEGNVADEGADGDIVGGEGGGDLG
jgi:DNA modification methylase